MTSVFLFCAVFAGLIAPADPYKQVAEHQLSTPSWKHPCGTDELGRDILSRVIHGARISFKIGVISVAIALFIGVPFGMVCGYLGGWVDTLSMRAIDILLGFPSILLAILIVSAMGPDILHVMIAVGIVNVPPYARQVRASVLGLRELDFVTASRAAGAGHARILWKAIFPNILSPILVLVTLGTGTAVLEAAGLSFLGLGGEPDLPEWGNMLTTTRQYIRTCPWVSLAPGLAISLTVLGFNLLGDALRDALDPRLRGLGTTEKSGQGRE